MKRMVAVAMVLVILLVCVSVANADTSRHDLANEYSSFCLKMANEYLKECNKANPEEAYIMLLFHYYFAYKETNAISLLEASISYGDPFGDTKMLDDMTTNSILDVNIRDEYKSWIRGKTDSKYLVTLLNSAIEGINAASK